MNLYHSSKRSIQAFVFFAIIIAATALGSQSCAASPDSAGASSITYDGVWTGETSGASSSVVTLTLQAAKRTLRYGSPRSCVLDLEAPTTTPNDGRKFAIISSSGVPCDKFVMGKLLLQAAGQGEELSYEVTDSNNKTVEKGQLHRPRK